MEVKIRWRKKWQCEGMYGMEKKKKRTRKGQCMTRKTRQDLEAGEEGSDMKRTELGREGGGIIDESRRKGPIRNNL